MTSSLTTADLSSLVESLRARFDVASLSVEAGGRTWQLLKPRNADDLLDEEEFEHDDRIPYWAELWPSARMLAERLARLDGRGRRMLELGCGVGLCALAAAQAGFQVLATDYYPEALEFVQVNAWRNGLSGLATRMVDWRELPDDLGTFDVIIGADVLYERPYAELIAAAIDKYLAPGGTALVTDPGRRFASAFPDACRARPLQVIEQDIIPLDHDGKEFTIELFEIGRA
ncbi:MAG: methyltransferase domain-containing protein [Planctomycetes bacterium]|nr:methyltransferase domain-containing protein [Planctomycetota bacterium]